MCRCSFANTGFWIQDLSKSGRAFKYQMWLSVGLWIFFFILNTAYTISGLGYFSFHSMQSLICVLSADQTNLTRTGLPSFDHKISHLDQTQLSQFLHSEALWRGTHCNLFLCYRVTRATFAKRVSQWCGTCVAMWGRFIWPRRNTSVRSVAEPSHKSATWRTISVISTPMRVWGAPPVPGLFSMSATSQHITAAVDTVPIRSWTGLTDSSYSNQWLTKEIILILIILDQWFTKEIILISIIQLFIKCSDGLHSQYLDSHYVYTGLILGLHPANERCRYKVTTSLIGWAQIWNQPFI